MADKSSNIWLVGTGQMSVEYAKVLKSLNVDFEVIGRGEGSAGFFEKETGIKPFIGGLDKFLSNSVQLPQKAIIAVGIESLSDICKRMMRYGVREILLEKPGFAYPAELNDLLEIKNNSSANVYLAYNRRFYASVSKAQELINEDGGITSFSFEFTEWSHIIRGLKKEKAEHHNWFIGNSTHVIDTAFYLGGKPDKLVSFTKGSLDWHPSSSVFAGAGISQSGALFSYQANWEGPGRWVVEFITNKRRLILKPMETLQVQEIGSVSINPVEINNQLDIDFKPGIYKQTDAFLKGNLEKFCTLEEQAQMINQFYLKMGGYKL